MHLKDPSFWIKFLVTSIALIRYRLASNHPYESAKIILWWRRSQEGLRIMTRLLKYGKNCESKRIGQMLMLKWMKCYATRVKTFCLYNNRELSFQGME